MATEVAMMMEMTMAMIVTVMPTGPIIKPRIIRAVHWPVVPVVGIAVTVVVTVMVINAAQNKGRYNSRADTPSPSMRFCAIGGPNHDHQAEGSGDHE